MDHHSEDSDPEVDEIYGVVVPGWDNDRHMVGAVLDLLARRGASHGGEVAGFVMRVDGYGCDWEGRPCPDGVEDEAGGLVDLDTGAGRSSSEAAVDLGEAVLCRGH